MKNVATKVEGNFLHIMVDLTQQHGPTKGGKGTVLAASEGFRNVGDKPTVAFNLMVYERKPKAAA
jgi:hypothetical protein